MRQVVITGLENLFKDDISGRKLKALELGVAKLFLKHKTQPYLSRQVLCSVSWHGTSHGMAHVTAHGTAHGMAHGMAHAASHSYPSHDPGLAVSGPNHDVPPCAFYGDPHADFLREVEELYQFIRFFA